MYLHREGEKDDTSQLPFFTLKSFFLSLFLKSFFAKDYVGLETLAKAESEERSISQIL